MRTMKSKLSICKDSLIIPFQVDLLFCSIKDRIINFWDNLSMKEGGSCVFNIFVFIYLDHKTNRFQKRLKISYIRV